MIKTHVVAPNIRQRLFTDSISRKGAGAVTTPHKKTREVNRDIMGKGKGRIH